MRFRPVRELLEDAMKELFEAKTWAEIDAHIRKRHLIFPDAEHTTIVVERYGGPDERIGWKETYLVLEKTFPSGKEYPVGYLDCSGADEL